MNQENTNQIIKNLMNIEGLMSIKKIIMRKRGMINKNQKLIQWRQSQEPTPKITKQFCLLLDMSQISKPQHLVKILKCQHNKLGIKKKNLIQQHLEQGLGFKNERSKKPQNFQRYLKSEQSQNQIILIQIKTKQSLYYNKLLIFKIQPKTNQIDWEQIKNS